jgi:Kef-type K+ transport system membrane component KefB
MFESLVVISLLAFFVPFVVLRFKKGLIPIVVGEIIAGMVFGDAGFSLIHNSPEVAFLALFGFAYLMFLTGLEVDFSVIRQQGTFTWKPTSILKNPAVAAAIIFLLTVAGSSCLAWLLFSSSDPRHILLIGLILSTSSVGIVVPTLREREMTRGAFGQTILMAALIADFVTIFFLTLLSEILVGGQVIAVLSIGFLFVAFGVAIYLGNGIGKNGAIRTVLDDLAHATSQIQVRGALALMVLFVALAESLGAEAILGSFLAGAVISSLSQKEGTNLRAKLDTIGYGFFVPVFFITVGASFDLDALRSSRDNLIQIPLLILVAYAVKILPALVLRASYSLRDCLAAGVLLSSRLSLIIAASLIGLELGVIDAATNAAFILVAVTTSVVSPMLFNWLYKLTPDPVNEGSNPL